jgi:hypothetical protein
VLEANAAQATLRGGADEVDKKAGILVAPRGAPDVRPGRRWQKRACGENLAITWMCANSLGLLQSLR